jgi:lipopolysaccharide/colanic/teichoic acid biosynthesis glycosyltransferase
MQSGVLLSDAVERALARRRGHATIRYHFAKRAVDLLIAVPALLISAPFIAIIAVLIRLDSPGPVFFRQLRVGQDGKLFAFYKFRTMWVDARARFPELYAYRYSADEIRSMYFKLPNDPRLTHFGRVLRKTTLDELPNFWNVVRGDMSLVGPRPEIPEMVPYYHEEQLGKFAVKPGITGLAQVSGRGLLRFQETIACDLEYCAQQSLGFDVLILFRTLLTVCCRVGAF